MEALILWCCKSAAMWAMHVGHLAVQFICDFIIEKWNGPWLSCRRYTSHPSSLAYSTTLLSTVAGGHWLWCGQMALGTPAFKWFNYFPFLSFLFLSFFYILAHAALLKTSFSLAESDGHFSITLLCQQRHSCNLSKVFKTAFGVIDLHRQTNTDDMKAVFFLFHYPVGVCVTVCVCVYKSFILIDIKGAE